MFALRWQNCEFIYMCVVMESIEANIPFNLYYVKRSYGLVPQGLTNSKIIDEVKDVSKFTDVKRKVTTQCHARKIEVLQYAGSQIRKAILKTNVNDQQST